MTLKNQSEVRAIRRYLLKHIAVLVQLQFSIETKDRINVLNSDKLSMYDQDDLLLLAFVARETPVEQDLRIIFSVEH
jgi:hypothetical protein